MTTTDTVSKTVTRSERFGTVTEYRIVLDGVTFEAGHMTGQDGYTVSSHVGRCGHSGRFNLAHLDGGRGIADRFERLAHDLRTDPAKFTDPDHNDPTSRSAAMCCDKDACDTFRPAVQPDPTTANDADRERARTAGVYAYNVGRPNVWQDDPKMQAILVPGDQHTARGARLIAIYETQWEACASYGRKPSAGDPDVLAAWDVHHKAAHRLAFDTFNGDDTESEPVALVATEPESAAQLLAEYDAWTTEREDLGCREGTDESPRASEWEANEDTAADLLARLAETLRATTTNRPADPAPDARTYVVGLPVVVQVHTDGTVTYDVDTAEAGSSVADEYDDLDVTDDVLTIDADHMRRHAERVA